MRYGVLSRILNLGVSVLLSDLDCIWLKKPWEFISKDYDVGLGRCADIYSYLTAGASKRCPRRL